MVERIIVFINFRNRLHYRKLGQLKEDFHWIIYKKEGKNKWQNIVRNQ